jgi:hypothetical protein
MPDKDYEIVLGDDGRIIVTVRMVGGGVVGFVVRLVARRGDVEVDVARYDTVHGKPHLDLLSASDTLKAKRWLDVDSFEQALTLAIEDFK